MVLGDEVLPLGILRLSPSSFPVLLHPTLFPTLFDDSVKFSLPLEHNTTQFHTVEGTEYVLV